MSAPLPIACIEAAGLAAVFAQWAYARCRDAETARACGWVSACLLGASAGFLILSWGDPLTAPQWERAARIPRTALADPRAPESFPATARDTEHGVDDLLARAGR